LRGIVDLTLESRREAIPHVEEIIAEFVERYGHWYRSRLAIPVIASLTKKAEALRAQEIAKLFSRCAELTDRERMLINGTSMKIVSKLLHSVITKIREKAIADHTEAINYANILSELFELQLAEAIAASETIAGPETAEPEAIAGPKTIAEARVITEIDVIPSERSESRNSIAPVSSPPATHRMC